MHLFSIACAPICEVSEEGDPLSDKGELASFFKPDASCKTLLALTKGSTHYPK